MNSYITCCTSEIAGYVTICTLMVYKPRLVALWILFYPGPAAHFALGECLCCGPGHVACYSCHGDQPHQCRHSSCLSGCKLLYRASWPWIDHAIRHSLGMHGLPTAEPARGPGPGVVFCGLQVCCMSLRPQPCMQQVEQGLAHSHSRVQAERPWCLWRRGRRGLAFPQRNLNLTI